MEGAMKRFVSILVLVLVSFQVDASSGKKHSGSETFFGIVACVIFLGSLFYFIKRDVKRKGPDLYNTRRQENGCFYIVMGIVFLLFAFLSSYFK